MEFKMLPFQVTRKITYGINRFCFFCCFFVVVFFFFFFCIIILLLFSYIFYFIFAFYYMFIIIWFNFQLYFRFLTILHWVFTQDLARGKGVIICILSIYVSCCLFWATFFCHIDSSLLGRWAVPQNAIFCISNRQRPPYILLMNLSIPFLIIPNAPTITGTLVALKCHISRSLYLLFLLYSLTHMLFSC